MPSVGVIIVAAGRGVRLGASVPKQLLEISGRTMLRWSVDAFDGHPAVRHIVVVLPEELVERGAALVGATRRPCTFTAGGELRTDSVRLGLSRLADDVDLVLIHDAARPFVDRALVDRVIAGAAEFGAAIPGVPARDTVKRVDVERKMIVETLPRREIWLAQTPQGFRRAVIERAMQEAGRRQDATDDALLAEWAGQPVQVVEGDERNMKITTQDDLQAARAAAAGAPRVGTGYDLHRLVDGRALVLAGVEVAADRGPDAHSDGDVVCHALTDAILGAAAAGDIGQHFPNTDVRWKDAPGLDLLARAVGVVRAQGWDVSSADVTVVLERPKLVPHVSEIRARLAGVLGVGVEAVGVKGKTNEGVDAVGRGEAIAAHAVAVLAAGAPR